MMSDTELLAPAGNFKTALAAFAAGADAVYCGLPDFSARAFADNLTIDDLKNLLKVARKDGKRVYVTFNTLIDEDDIEPAVEQLAKLDEIRPDALIVQDLGVARLCRKYFPDLELHASTQLVAHNLEGVLALKELGFSRVVLARELSLGEIASIAKRCGVELEVFIHGALCYSLSGLCLFGAMEKGRSGNRGKCPYCCRQAMKAKGLGEGEQGSLDLHSSPSPSTFASCFPFSMKDLRLGEDVRKLADAGVASLKIEGRMKSSLYVASVTRYYREILDGNREMPTAVDRRRMVTVADLETVFSRRTTKLYFDGAPGTQHQTPSTKHQAPSTNSPVDPESLGHLGAEIGTVKRVTKDRDGLSWLRFHTVRALEKHDGLQFEARKDGKPLGMGIVEMRQAISRRSVFEVAAGEDVEVLLPEENGPHAEVRSRGESADEQGLARTLKPGMKIYCSMSNAVKRAFPEPSFRPSDYEGGTAVDLEVKLGTEGLTCRANSVSVSIACALQPAKNPEKTFAAVEKAFSKFGDTDYRLGKLKVDDPDRLFAPMSVLNDLRRDLVEKLDAARDKARREKIERALADVPDTLNGQDARSPSVLNGQDARFPRRVGKVRVGQKVPAGEWDEVVVAINAAVDESRLQSMAGEYPGRLRLALPVYTAEPEFNKLRSAVKRCLRAGFAKWEASDLATLRMLKQLGVEDVTADWTLYAFNLNALRQLSDLGVKRFVASPENGRENLQFLAESGYDVEFLVQQSTPLFISLTRPAAVPEDLAILRRDGLWVTTKPVPRTFEVPEGASTRLDLSWDPE